MQRRSHKSASVFSFMIGMEKTSLLHEPFTLSAPDGAPIVGTIRTENNAERKPLVLVLHGLKGFKDWGFFPYTCEYFARCAAITMSINFSLNGMREGSDVFDDLDNFARNTISREVEEVALVLQALHSGGIANNALEQWDGRIFVLGHSRGGGVALLATRNNQERVHKTATWNAVSTFDRFTNRQKQAWRAAGVLESPNARTKQVMAMKVSYLDDIEQHADRLTPAMAVADIRTPVLIIHAEQDLTVPVREAKRLAGAQPAAQLVLIPQTGHTFHAVHPFAGTTAPLEEALDKTRIFFGLPRFIAPKPVL